MAIDSVAIARCLSAGGNPSASCIQASIVHEISRLVVRVTASLTVPAFANKLPA
jgi:hypothetical protein